MSVRDFIFVFTIQESKIDMLDSADDVKQKLKKV